MSPSLHVVGILLAFMLGFVSQWGLLFWITPIHEYKKLRARVLSDLDFYANAIAPPTQRDVNAPFDDRRAANRRQSTDLSVLLAELPWFYQRYLDWKKVEVAAAARELMGLSNTIEYDSALSRMDKIRQYLGKTAGQ